MGLLLPSGLVFPIAISIILEGVPSQHSLSYNVIIFGGGGKAYAQLDLAKWPTALTRPLIFTSYVYSPRSQIYTYTSSFVHLSESFPPFSFAKIHRSTRTQSYFLQLLFLLTVSFSRFPSLGGFNRFPPRKKGGGRREGTAIPSGIRKSENSGLGVGVSEGSIRFLLARFNTVASRNVGIA